MISKEKVLEAQKEWGNGVVKIGSLKDNRAECDDFTEEFLKKLYSFGTGPVLFTATKCAVEQFRPTKEEANSYFIAGENKACNEDNGFAINPWTKVRFENSDVIISGNTALAMGNYFFTGPDSNDVKVEYTFGYIEDDQGNLRIQLHHSSMPAES